MSNIPIMVMPWHRPDPCKPSKMQTNAAFKPTYLDHLTSLQLDSPSLAYPLTRIMCTIGTASDNMDMMIDLMEQGMSMALIPLALGNHQDHLNTITNVRNANIAFNQMKKRVFPLAIAVQTKGPGLRIGAVLKDIPVQLSQHSKVTLSTDKAWRTKGTEHYLYLGYPEMGESLMAGNMLLLGSGAVILEVEVVDGHEAVCVVKTAGLVHSYMPVTVHDVPVRLPPLTDEDEDDLLMAASLGLDIVVATHTQTADHIRNVRKVLAGADKSATGIKVWAQLETKDALDNLESIAKEADAVLLSRLSLTHDISANKLFLAQKIVLGTCNKAGIPVFLSSHFLPSMQAELNPSISELTDVSCAILDGADGFVLNNTTAMGKHPDHTVKTLRAVCLEAEAAVWQHQTFNYLNSHEPPPIDPTHAIAISAVEASLKASASAIFLATTSGHSAQLMARYRPRCPILAVTRYGQVARQLNSWRGVIPLHYVDPPLPDWTREVDVRLQFAIEFAKLKNIVKPGDPVILMNGWRHGAGFTNTIRIVYVSDSFPWVYPHRFPPVIPSDNAITDSERKLTAKVVSEDQIKTNSKASHLSTTGDSVLKSSLNASKVDSFTKPPSNKSLIEEEFKAVETVRSKELEQHTLTDAVNRYKSGGVVADQGSPLGLGSDKHPSEEVIKAIGSNDVTPGGNGDEPAAESPLTDSKIEKDE